MFNITMISAWILSLKWELCIIGVIYGGGHGNPLQYFCLKNPMDREAWQTTVHRVTQN